ncbi:putative RNA recognition motif domain, nucleotide-binding alpha-beta plait domain superfamily [Helianthus annuus]|nr:putative RNA recognition motif domain, nucleotide-binding alpha-beta plait domain superfamily [Helianthus annuus]
MEIGRQTFANNGGRYNDSRHHEDNRRFEDNRRWDENTREEPWRVARYKGRRLVHEDKQQKRPQRTETTYFIGNLPDDCSSYLLWEVFQDFGNMTDAYIPQKKDRMGNTFGFIRFAGVRDVHALGENLGSVKIDRIRVSVNLAKFEKNDFGSKKNTSWSRDNMRLRKNNNRPVTPHANSTRFAVEASRKEQIHHVHQNQNEAWQPKNTTVQNEKNAAGEKNEPNIVTGIQEVKAPEESLEIQLQESENSKRWRRKSLIGEIRNPFDLKDIGTQLERVGLSGFVIKYLGGLRVMLVFKTSTEAEEFIKLKEELWSIWFVSLYPWEGQNLPFQRLAWILIKGVPLQFWGPDIFNQIGKLVGKVIIPSRASDDDVDLSVNKIGVLSNKVGRINCKLTLQWGGEPCFIWISETDTDPPEWFEDSRNDSMSSEWEVGNQTDVHEEVETSVLGNENGTGGGFNEKSFHNSPTLKNRAASYVGSKDGGNNMGATSFPNDNNNSGDGNMDSNNNSGDPCDTPPPPHVPQNKPNNEPNSGMGLNELFNNEEFVDDTPTRPTEDNADPMSSDPFNIMEVINQMAQKNKEIIDLNNSPNSPQLGVNDSRSSHQKLGQKKKKHNFPSMKMKDTLWMGRISEASKSRSRGSTTCEEAGSARVENTYGQAIDEEAELTIKVGEKLGFRVSGCEERIKKQINDAQVTNLHK